MSSEQAGDPLVKVTLVPVEVFGAEDGYGLCDAVSPWSDCNRARGHIYRRDENPQYRDPSDVITVYVPQSEVAKFDQRFGEGRRSERLACVQVSGVQHCVQYGAP